MRLSQHNNTLNNQDKLPVINRYVVYCRKSSESDERQIQSLPDQIHMLVSFVTSKGLQIIGEPLQESKSAKIPGRPVFNQLVQKVEDGEANCIVLLNPSRLSRNTVDTGRIIYLMDQGKLQEVVTPYQTFKNNPYDKFMLNLLCTQAKLENDNKSVNVRESLRLKAERGVFPGKARPGYKNNHDKPQGLRDISAHPVYFPLMRKLFDLALTGNYSIERLIKEAEYLGIRSSKSGKPICKSWMHRLLRDPFYTGKFIYCGKLYQGSHTALITDEEFNLLQDIIEGRSKGKTKKHDSALNGMIKCGECGYCITAETHTKHYKNGNSQVFAYYRCTKKNKENKCNQKYLAADKLEGQYTEDLTHFELMPEFAQWALEALDEVKKKDNNVNKNSHEALQKALEGVNKRINNLVSLKISPDNSDGSLLSDEEFGDRKRTLLFEKEKIMKQLS
ncbi:MAG: Recombinase [Candidatus Roizmanbacteria bacterium GW2011_GWA2_37_7]|uniref:Recombinase n=1 Tax=Candidatus Roizmanbacteria bacterium GW2011_GWA2_37_7 TaxID=1618481 RepID=A0A0G0JLP9_9BACT|nr:MAG: Recombinase [Candidatus Roizmanbacteria bacterium GW2011_GWA2_37_7]